MIVEEIEKNLILDSIWIGKNSAPNCSVYHSYKVCSDDIEYVRKDVARAEVIEKALEWLEENLNHSYEYYNTTSDGRNIYLAVSRLKDGFRKALEEDGI